MALPFDPKLETNTPKIEQKSITMATFCFMVKFELEKSLPSVIYYVWRLVSLHNVRCVEKRRFFIMVLHAIKNGHKNLMMVLALSHPRS